MTSHTGTAQRSCGFALGHSNLVGILDRIEKAIILQDWLKRQELSFCFLHFCLLGENITITHTSRGQIFHINK